MGLEGQQHNCYTEIKQPWLTESQSGGDVPLIQGLALQHTPTMAHLGTITGGRRGEVCTSGAVNAIFCVASVDIKRFRGFS